MFKVTCLIIPPSSFLLCLFAFQQGDAQILVQPHAAGPGPLRPALRRLRRPHPRPPRPRPQAQMGQTH